MKRANGPWFGIGVLALVMAAMCGTAAAFGGRGGHGGGFGGGGHSSSWHGGGWGGHAGSGGHGWGGRGWGGYGHHGYGYGCCGWDYGFVDPYWYAYPWIDYGYVDSYAALSPPVNPAVISPPPPTAPSYWYYCPDSRTYYPYVRQCASGWQKVNPTP